MRQVDLCGFMANLICIADSHRQGHIKKPRIPKDKSVVRSQVYEKILIDAQESLLSPRPESQIV